MIKALKTTLHPNHLLWWYVLWKFSVLFQSISWTFSSYSLLFIIFSVDNHFICLISNNKKWFQFYNLICSWLAFQCWCQSLNKKKNVSVEVVLGLLFILLIKYWIIYNEKPKWQCLRKSKCTKDTWNRAKQLAWNAIKMILPIFIHSTR